MWINFLGHTLHRPTYCPEVVLVRLACTQTDLYGTEVVHIFVPKRKWTDLALPPYINFVQMYVQVVKDWFKKICEFATENIVVRGQTDSVTQKRAWLHASAG